MEELMWKLIEKLGVTQAVIVLIIINIVVIVRKLKFNHFKNIISPFKDVLIVFLDKEKKKLKKDNKLLIIQLTETKETLDRILKSNAKDRAIQRLIDSFRDRFNLAYVHIFEYHNGVKNIGEDCMYKYTMVYTAPHPLGFDLRFEHENQSLAKFSEIIEIMIKEGIYDTEIKKFPTAKRYAEKTGVEREISVFLNRLDTKKIFGALSINLLPSSSLATDYIEELKYLQLEIETIYQEYRNEDSTKLD